MRRIALLTLALAPPALFAQAGKPDPAIQKIVSEISSEKVGEYMKKLGSFGTRGNFTDPAQTNQGIGAARRWIYDQFRSFSPRLDVSFDPYKVQKEGRIFRDVEVVNVVAVLPGTTQPEKRLIVSGHYDSLNIVTKPGAGDFRSNGDGATDSMDNEASAIAPAPGVGDDASGTAVVMELARVMSQYKFEKTIVFVAFAGEEIGLVGSSLYADKAKAHGDKIEAVLNNDIVGYDVTGAGRAASGYVNVFSDEPADSTSRELARYVRDCAQLYVPGFGASPVFRGDRFSRGGDHTPFVMDGYAGVRFTTPAENLGIQHTKNDTFDKTSPVYAANVARVNGAALASLALAPPPPVVTREVTTGANKGRLLPNIGRGKSLYDAVLKWKDEKPAEDLDGYAIVVRSTTEPFWDHQILVGKVNEYTLQGLSIDDVVIGVKAIDKDGHESLVSAYVAQPYQRRPIKLQDEATSAQK
ncbi:MAG TPA: M20/M25/M40 family metallo-hydrolase [Bryobacteraceae bacterium]|nr:M20/M25/M40 family metallo-hydrolase [Bryobacteraceae bacterium]